MASAMPQPVLNCHPEDARGSFATERDEGSWFASQNQDPSRLNTARDDNPQTNLFQHGKAVPSELDI